MPVWRRIEDAARKVAETYGYREMRTPLLESTELFIRSVGEVTDIVEMEMFTFDPSARPDGPRSGVEKDSLTLRPELTASFVRACVEHGLFKKKAFQKLFYIGANFRKERPQKGRLRQFHQFGVEALGATDPLLDAETVLLALRFFEEIGGPGVKTRVNSIGCPNCRPKYREALKAKFAPLIGQLCENCRRRFDRNVFRILDCRFDSPDLSERSESKGFARSAWASAASDVWSSPRSNSAHALTTALDQIHCAQPPDLCESTLCGGKIRCALPRPLRISRHTACVKLLHHETNRPLHSRPGRCPHDEEGHRGSSRHPRP